MADTITSGQVVTGPLRRPVNAARNIKGSIHDDETASRLGLRGGTVAGSIHLDLFPPLLLEAFGPSWFETGSLSIDFRNPTTDGEPVRASVGRPTEGPAARSAQVPAWIDREDGMRVGEGTAAVGPPSVLSALRAKDISRFSDGAFRILEGVDAGDEIPATEVTVDPTDQARLLDEGRVAEPMDWYEKDSPWGAPLLVPKLMVHYLYQPGSAFLTRGIRDRGGAVGLFGAIELVNLAGPLLLGRTYEVSGRVLAVGQSPKTEYAWFEATATENSKPVAGLLMQLRFMKASSPLYASS